ncbi:MAG: outer membrane lipoprotein carrier protein LolA [Pseudomonadota bacterium]
MKKKIILTLLALAISNVTFAAGIDGLVSRVEGKYSEIKSFQADFVQKTYIEMLGRNVSKTGKLILAKGNKFRIDYSGEDENNYISDGKKLWIYTPGDESSLEAYSLNKSDIPKVALSILSNFKNLKKLFVIKGSNEFTVKGDDYQLLLIPKKKKDPYSKIVALFNGKDLLIRLKIYNRSGNITDYQFSNLAIDKSTSDAQFNLPKF